MGERSPLRRRWAWISATLLLVGIVLAIASLPRAAPKPAPIQAEAVETEIPERWRPLVGGARAWEAATHEEHAAFLRWAVDVGLEVQRRKASALVRQQHTARIAKASRITSDLFHILALCSLLLMLRPFFVSRERAPKRFALWAHSALATGTLVVSLFLLQGCLELLMSVTTEVSGLASPDQALVDTGFARIRTNVEEELERLAEDEQGDGTPYPAVVVAAGTHNGDGFAVNVLRNLQYVDPSSFEPAVRWSKRIWALLAYLPLIVPFIVVLVVLLTMRETLAQIIHMPIDAARGEKRSGRRAVGRALLFVAKEFLSIVALVAVLIPAGTLGSLGVRRITHDAISILLAQSRSTLAYLGQLAEPPPSGALTFGLLAVPVLLAVASFLGTLAITLFGLRARKLLHNRVHRGWPLRRKDRMWRRSFLAMLRIQWIPVLLVWVLTPGLVALHANDPSSTADAFARMTTTGTRLAIGLPAAFLLFGGIGALVRLWPFQRLAPAPKASYTLRDRTPEDDAFLVRAHHAGLRPSIEAAFGPWDAAVQDRFAAEWLARGTPRIVLVDGEPAGYLETEDRPTQVYVSNIVLLPAFQSRGIGTRILQDVIEDANARSLPVQLQVFKVNPARELYERLGFKQIGETEHHIQMLRPPTPVP